jgi:hypothetical protein
LESFTCNFTPQDQQFGAPLCSSGVSFRLLQSCLLSVSKFLIGLRWVNKTGEVKLWIGRNGGDASPRNEATTSSR